MRTELCGLWQKMLYVFKNYAGSWGIPPTTIHKISNRKDHQVTRKQTLKKKTHSKEQLWKFNNIRQSENSRSFQKGKQIKKNRFIHKSSNCIELLKSNTRFLKTTVNAFQILKDDEFQSRISRTATYMN